jgi:UDP-N-acetylmuramoyl-L-alanyl-D-glutamate--2,6-diaminopimelate ligase
MKYIDLTDRQWTFEKILREDEVLSSSSWPHDTSLTRLVLHSNEVRPGDIFLAIPPLQDFTKGQDHLKEALERGAKVIIKQNDVPLPLSTGKACILDVENARKTRSLIAHRLFPGQPSKVVAVTGTNGKSSVVSFCHQLWQCLGYQSASLGTLGIDSDVDLSTQPTISLTSPDPFDLHQTLSYAKEKGITHVALEASSHGLDQHRLDGLTLVSAGFTNLSQDHLDYHQTMNRYYDAKARLFQDLLPEGETAVLNADTNYFDPLKDLCLKHGLKVISYGKRATDIHLEDLSLEGPQQIATLSILRHTYKLRLNFIGKFQVLNALCALGLVIAAGEPAEKVVKYLEKLRPIMGRLELIGTTKTGGAVYVDYAHTPDALHEALLSVRPYVHGILTVLFGCGGNRDAGKRPQMGGIAGRFSDAQIVTDDNPRDEDPAAIRRAILLGGCTNAQEIPDRREAIKRAIERLSKGDAVLIAGKGHETTQIIKGQHLSFSDRDFAKTCILETGGELAA